MRNRFDSSKFTELFSVFDSIETSVSPVAPDIRAIDIPEKVVEDAKRLLAKVPQKPILTEREQELLQFFGIEVLSNAKGFLSVKAHEICPFFDTAVSLELFPVHPNVLKNPNAPQKNRVALIYGSNGSGKSTIAQGFREYAESVVPKTVELNPTAGAAIIKMSSGMKSEKIVHDKSSSKSHFRPHR